MRLLEAILEANRRRLAGDSTAAIAPADHAATLPLAALTCIDPRLNHVLPDALGLPEESFIWLRNAGNIISGPLSSTMRSLALGCAVKGGKEIAIIGHSDCQVCKTTMLQLLDRLTALGVDRRRLPENLVEYFGLFASERQNVMRAVEIVRSSPLIGMKVPVHGLLIDLPSGRLECVTNGYDAPAVMPPGKAGELFAQAERSLDLLEKIGNVASEQLNLPTAKIGEITSSAEDWLHRAERAAAAVLPSSATPPVATPPAAPSKTTPPPVANPLATLQERMRRFSAERSGSGASRKH